MGQSVSEHESGDFLSVLDSTVIQEEIAQKATAVARQIPEIEAVILRGSLATQSGDVFSDIDLLLVCRSLDQVAGLKNTFLSRADSIGSLVHHYSSVVNPVNHLLFFEPLVQLELDFKTYEQAANSWKTANGRLLYDRTRRGRSAIEASRQKRFDIESCRPFLTNTAAVIPVSVCQVCGYYTRGERLTAWDDLDWLRNLMLRASGYLLGMWDEGPRRAETRFPAEVVHYYRETRAVSTTNLWDAVDLLLKWYVEWMVPRLQRIDVQVKNDLLARVRTYVNRLHHEDRSGSDT